MVCNVAGSICRQLTRDYLTPFITEEPKNCNYDRERLIVSGIVDYPIPECDSQGNYKKVQCSYAWGLQCWCADKNGNAYANTTVNEDTPDCSEEGTLTRYTVCTYL